ncbi:MAG: sulfite exporter TauE/SafE family protein [Ilumatobacteraceae bacterium]
MPLLALILDTRDASMIATMLSMLTSGSQAVEFRRHVQGGLTTRLVLAMFAGMPLGLWLFARADERVLRVLLSVTILVLVVLLARGLDLSGHGGGLDFGIGLTAGALTTSLSTNGPPLVFLLQSRRLAPEAFRGTIAAIFTITAVVSAVARGAIGGFTRPVVVGSLVALVPLVLGRTIGIRARSRLHGDRFRNAVLVLLAAAAISAVIPVF